MVLLRKSILARWHRNPDGQDFGHSETTERVASDIGLELLVTTLEIGEFSLFIRKGNVNLYLESQVCLRFS